MADLTGMLRAAAGASTGNPNAWDIGKAYYDAGADAWDVSKAFYSSVSFSVAGQETAPVGLFFKPDGTKMYISGTTGQDVNEYNLSTPWLVSSATYVQNFSVSAQETTPNGLSFKPDGTKMYILGNNGDDVNEYDLSTPWDISTASYLQNFSIATQETIPQDLFFKPDGTKMYIVGTSTDSVNEYNLSTQWDISTASHVQSFFVGTEEGAPTGLFFKSDGTKMYITGTGGDEINEYDLSTPWDISSASYLQNFSVATQETAPQSLFLHPDGSGFYVVGFTNDTVYQYTIGGFSVAAQEINPTGVFFKPDGTKMYVIGTTGDDVNEYSLSSAWDVTTASYVQNFSVATQETNPSDLFFKPDGTKMYMLGFSGQDVNEYSLSTPWDVSTASYVQNFSVATQETAPQGLFFKPDGTKMYVIGTTGDDVNEYSLSSAWDISTASFVQVFSVLAQEATPLGLFFKPDGTKMYVVGSSGEDVNEYNLSTPWDISTASYVQNFSLAAQEDLPQGLFWKDDGTQFWVVGRTTDTVFSYKISSI
jgi:sugar lactone lactonase YvrE